jgi:hypothetical protein
MEIKLFKPYTLQKEFIDKFSDTEDLFGVVVSPRGSGKTLLGINLMLYWLLQKPGRKGGWVSPVYSQAKSVYDTFTRSSKEIITAGNRMDMIISFVNGSTLKFLSSDSPDSIRGFRFSHLILDEMAFMKELTITQAILPTLNPQGKKCLMISTPKGRNHFYDWFNKEDVVKQRFKLDQCPYVKQELIDQARKSLPIDLFKQEFEAQFVDAANDVFVGVDKVANIDAYDDVRNQEVFIGIDTGLSDDASVLVCISPMGRVVYIESISNTEINTVATKFNSVLQQYRVVGGYVEINGIGRATYDLMKDRYKKVRPFTTTQDNKTEMVRKLIADIESLSIELPSEELCPTLHREFSSYSYKMSPTGKLSFGHRPGHKDDHIDALLMANYSRVKFIERKPVRVAGVKPVWQNSYNPSTGPK